MKKLTVICGVFLAAMAFYGCAAQTPLSNVSVMPLKAGGIRTDHSLLILERVARSKRGHPEI